MGLSVTAAASKSDFWICEGQRQEWNFNYINGSKCDGTESLHERVSEFLIYNFIFILFLLSVFEPG